MNGASAPEVRPLHGWHSEIAIQMGLPTFIYRRKNGEEVELYCVTYVHHEERSGPFPDMRYMGEFVEFVRSGRPSRRNRQPLEVK